MIKKICNYLYKTHKGSLYGDYGFKDLFDVEKYLKDLIHYAHIHVPYYREIFNDIEIVKEGVVDLSKIQKMPILTKDILKKEFSSLASDEYQRRGWYTNHSGGSTGEPTKFIQDKTYRKYGYLRDRYYHKEILGIDLDTVNKVILWGSTRDIIKQKVNYRQSFINWFQRSVFLNGFKMSEQDQEGYVKTINSFKPVYLRGYAGSLFELAKFIEAKNVRIHSPHVIISAAEILTDEMRAVIERAFKAKVYNFYGSREVGGIAGECKNGLMHIFSFFNNVEVVDKDNKPVKEGEEGRVIVTNLFNYSMPFIRYDIGDRAVLGPVKCSCGNPLPTLKRIIGRVTDHFIKADGSVVPAEFFIHFIGVVCNKGSIKQFQVVQEDYRKVRIFYVAEKQMEIREKQDVDEKIKKVMGQDCQIIWEQVQEIPKTPEGKYLYTRCLINQNRH